MDIGEGFPFDVQLLEFATSANVCCGEHAGSRELTRETIALCLNKGVRIGAHPGYPDRAELGRRPLTPEFEQSYLSSVFAQIYWFVSVEKPTYLKPHGGFYNDTGFVLPEDWQTAKSNRPEASTYENGGVFLSFYPGIHSLVMLLRAFKLSLMGLPGTSHEVIADRARRPFLREGFADRKYRPDGTLTPRSEVGAVLSDLEEVKEQTLRHAESVDSICLHGDNPHCLEFAEVVFRTLVDNGYEVRA